MHLAIPERRALSETVSPSSASIFIKYRPGAAVAGQSASIKALVVNSIEGLPYDNVTVSFFPASRAHHGGTRRQLKDIRLAGVSLDARTAMFVLGLLVIISLAVYARSAWSRNAK